LEVVDWLCEKLRLLHIDEGWRQANDFYLLKKNVSLLTLHMVQQSSC
jgi:hypothetical protein